MEAITHYTDVLVCQVVLALNEWKEHSAGCRRGPASARQVASGGGSL